MSVGKTGTEGVAKMSTDFTPSGWASIVLNKMYDMAREGAGDYFFLHPSDWRTIKAQLSRKGVHNNAIKLEPDTAWDIPVFTAEDIDPGEPHLEWQEDTHQCNACGARLRASDTHWSLWLGSWGGFACQVNANL